jgi:hypothetical protein
MNSFLKNEMRVCGYANMSERKCKAIILALTTEIEELRKLRDICDKDHLKPDYSYHLGKGHFEIIKSDSCGRTDVINMDNIREDDLIGCDECGTKICGHCQINSVNCEKYICGECDEPYLICKDCTPRIVENFQSHEGPYNDKICMSCY